MNSLKFSEKLTRYKDTVFRTAFAFCRNTADAEDVSQDVFIKLYTSDIEFHTHDEEKAWLIRVTVNKCKDLRKSKWFVTRTELDENIPASSQDDTENSEVLKAVLSLSEKYRIVIHLYYFEGYSVGEIADITKRKPSTVQTQLQRGRELLKKQLGEGYDYEYGNQRALLL